MRSPAQAEAAIDAVMRGDVPDAELSQFVLDLRARGETPDEVAGAALRCGGTCDRSA
ncbi:MAG: hypothetical protein QM811_30960 [Pirellulales bacterium]